MSRCNCGATTAEGCQCSFTDSDCFSIEGSGSAENPFMVEANLDPAEDNLLECSESGLGAFLPPEIADPPRCQIVRSIDQTIPSGVTQWISFDTLPVYDTANMYDGASDPTQIVIQFDGTYHISGVAGWEEPASDAFASWAIVQLPADTSVISVGAVIASGPGSPTWRIPGDNDWELNAGDTLAMRVFQNVGTDLVMVGARLTVRYVAPLSS